MIYSFEKTGKDLNEFIDFLKERRFDYELIEREKIVVRIFGSISEEQKTVLDKISRRNGSLVLKKNTPETADNGRQFIKTPLVIAGPCSVESEEQLEKTAAFISGLGIKYLRGGAFKPRTSSASFQGLGRKGLELMAQVASRNNLKIVTEVMDRSQLDLVERTADIIQVGSRNMFNYSLLTVLGAVDKPVLLKRGMAATIDEWVKAAGYILKGGNERIILCERGIRTFEPETRFTLDILAVPIARQKSGLPVIVDASHAAGRRHLVPILMKAALAAGADGVMVEVHPDPSHALSDGAQSMTFDDFTTIFKELNAMKFLPDRLE